MKRTAGQRGLTLIEMLVVVGIIAMLVGLGAPAVKALLASFESEDSVRAMVQTALSTARGMAMEQQRYAGVRFQKASCGEGDGLANPQYMTFIVHDNEATGLASGFRAVEGLKPIRLPDRFGVMDLVKVDRVVGGSNAISIQSESPVSKDADIDTVAEVNDVTTFSVVFSPAGHLVTHQVRIRNRDGKSSKETPPSKDDIFNTEVQVFQKSMLDRRGMFLQDDYVEWGLGPESSRRSFVIYKTQDFSLAYRTSRPYTNYLKDLVPKVLYVTPLTGALTGGQEGS
jgi:prepilin-type N-terminal cleavage/methylation domain-containing protein